MLLLLRTTVETPRSCSFPMAVNASSSVVTGCLVNTLQQKKKYKLALEWKEKLFKWNHVNIRMSWVITKVLIYEIDSVRTNSQFDWLVACLLNLIVSNCLSRGQVRRLTSDNSTFCHTETELRDNEFCLSRSQYTDIDATIWERTERVSNPQPGQELCPTDWATYKITGLSQEPQ